MRGLVRRFAGTRPGSWLFAASRNASTSQSSTRCAAYERRTLHRGIVVWLLEPAADRPRP
jgi:hypothetical protein